MQKRVLKGSNRKPVAGAKLIGKADENRRIEVTVVLKPAAQLKPAEVARQAKLAPQAREVLSREDFAARFGASKAAVAAVERYAAEHGLEVVAQDLAARRLRVAGTIAAMERAFGVTLNDYAVGQTHYRGREGELKLPAEIVKYVDAVIGLDDRPMARPHFRKRLPRQPKVWKQPSHEVARLYDFPEADGAGQTVAIIELGGAFGDADLDTYFKRIKRHRPKVTGVYLHGSRLAYNADPGNDEEVMLDVEVIGAIVPHAHIVVYFAPNTDDGFYDAISQAVHDPVNKPSVVSISWGSKESDYTEQTRRIFDDLGVAAAALGVTILCSSGDNGVSDQGVHDRDFTHRRKVEFPSSSPHFITCGGTSISTDGKQIVSEVVWNDADGASGGGVSKYAPVPSWQRGLSAVRGKKLTGRGVPDVAGNADPQTGYDIFVHRRHLVYGGTSAVAPLWAGLIARINQILGAPVGLFTPVLYGTRPRGAGLRPIVTGHNGFHGISGYQAGPGWNACTGLGSPNGKAVLALLDMLPRA
jgi:kumamolisin